MSGEEERLRTVLRDTVTLLCRNSVAFQDQLTVQGLLAVTVDTASVVILQVNEIVEKAADGTISVTSAEEASGGGGGGCKCCCTCGQAQRSSPSKTTSRRFNPTTASTPRTSRNNSTETMQSESSPNVNQNTSTTAVAGDRTDPVVVKKETTPAAPEVDHRMELADDVVHIEVGEKDGSGYTETGGPFVAGVAHNSKNAKGVQSAPIPMTSRTEFHDSQLASFATLAQDIHLGSGQPTDGVTWAIPVTTTPVGEQMQRQAALHHDQGDRAIPQAPTQPPSTTQDPGGTGDKIPLPSVTTDAHLTLDEKKALRAEKARQYRLAMRNNPALRHKYEETKRKNRERMQRHRQMMGRGGSSTPVGQGGFRPGPVGYQLSTSSIRARTPSSSPEDAKLWQDIHTWQTQPLGLTASGMAPLVTHALQTPQMLLPSHAHAMDPGGPAGTSPQPGRGTASQPATMAEIK